MAYNYQLRTKQLGRVNLERIKKGIYLAYSAGVTSNFMTGYFSGDSIVLYGTAEGGRKSLISLRNYCDNVELLVTDSEGNFLFYGRYHRSMELDVIARLYLSIINRVRRYIRGSVPSCKVPENIRDKDLLKGFERMQEAHDLMILTSPNYKP